MTKTVPAVALARVIGLLSQIERGAGLFRRHQRVGLMERRIEELRVGNFLEVFHGVIDHVSPLAATFDAHCRDVVGRQHVGHFEIRLRGVGVEHERVVRLAEITRVLAVRHVAEHRTHVGMVEPALEEPPGLHHLVTGVMNSGGSVIERPYQRPLVGVPRHAGEDFGNLDAGNVRLDRLIRAANFRRRVRLHIPGIELARSTDKKEHDHVDVALVVVDRALRFERQEVGQTEAQHAGRTGVQEIAAAEAVTEADGFVVIESKHG